LIQETNSSFKDWILRLNVLRETRDPEFEPSLAACQRKAAANPSLIYELATWEMAYTSPADTLVWVRSLPMSTQTNQPTTLMITECYAALEDWHGELEFLRHAFLARASRGLALPGSASAEWDQAQQSASGQKQSLIMLFKLAAHWNWANEQEDLLWNFVNRYPQEKWATQTLSQALFAAGQTRQLMRLVKQESERSPSDLVAKNNLAMLALLLDAKEVRPFDLAREVYQQAPTNSSFAVTYAFSLYTQGKNAEALKVMQGINPHDLESPNRAGYYGLILKATGSLEKAKVCLDLSSKATLLPEEKILFDRAKNGT
jgi:hypothetical protein